MPDRQDNVEAQFVRPIVTGAAVMPHRVLDFELGVLPWDGKRLLATGDTQIDNYPSLAARWTALEQTWNELRSSERLDLGAESTTSVGSPSSFPSLRIE